MRCVHSMCACAIDSGLTLNTGALYAQARAHICSETVKHGDACVRTLCEWEQQLRAWRACDSPDNVERECTRVFAQSICCFQTLTNCVPAMTFTSITSILAQRVTIVCSLTLSAQ
jgi:hypothetical protein